MHRFPVCPLLAQTLLLACDCCPASLLHVPASLPCRAMSCHGCRYITEADFDVGGPLHHVQVRHKGVCVISSWAAAVICLTAVSGGCLAAVSYMACTPACPRPAFGPSSVLTLPPLAGCLQMELLLWASYRGQLLARTVRCAPACAAAFEGVAWRQPSGLLTTCGLHTSCTSPCQTYPCHRCPCFLAPFKHPCTCLAPHPPTLC